MSDTQKYRIIETKRLYSYDELMNLQKRLNAGNLTKEERRVQRGVTRAYERIPQSLQKIDKNKKARITQNILMIFQKPGGIASEKSFRQSLEAERKVSRFGDARYGTAKTLWDVLRSDATDLYHKYNSYIYRLGYSASEYWFKNVVISVADSITTGTLELPFKESGVIYNTLFISFDFSSGMIIEAGME